MTSNIGSHRILDYKGSFDGADYAIMRATVLDELRQHFRPEFLNRVDEIIVFHALTEDELLEIVDIQLRRLRQRLAERRITLVLSDAAKRHIVKVGYDPAYGARPLKRTIQKELETPLGRKILAGEINEGDTVDVGFDENRGELTFAIGDTRAGHGVKERHADCRFYARADSELPVHRRSRSRREGHRNRLRGCPAGRADALVRARPGFRAGAALLVDRRRRPGAQRPRHLQRRLARRLRARRRSRCELAGRRCSPIRHRSRHSREMQVWSVATGGGAPKLLGSGDAPAISPDGARVAFTSGGAVTVAPIDGSAAAKRLFFDRGQDSDLHWSPDGSALAFVSARNDHSFIGIYRNDSTPIRVSRADDLARFLAALVAGRTQRRVRTIARRRRSAAEPADVESRSLADLGCGTPTAAPRISRGRARTRRADRCRRAAADRCSEWAAQNRLVFKSEQDNWPHLYAVSADGGRRAAAHARRLHGRRRLGRARSSIRSCTLRTRAPTAGDDDRRHLFRVDMNSGAIAQLASGASSETSPVALAGGAVAFNRATAQQPLLVTLLARRVATSARRRLAADRLPVVAARDAASSLLHRCRRTHLRPALSAARRGKASGHHLRARRPAAADAADVALHGLLLQRVRREPVFGEPRVRRARRQLSARHRLRPRLQLSAALGADGRLGVPGRRRGRAFLAARAARWIPSASASGADRTAATSPRWRSRATPTSSRRASTFTACTTGRSTSTTRSGASSSSSATSSTMTKALMKLAWESSPDSAIATWKSPVLLIQGDDDRNVEFHQMVDLVAASASRARAVRGDRDPQRDPRLSSLRILAGGRHRNGGLSDAPPVTLTLRRGASRRRNLSH